MMFMCNFCTDYFEDFLTYKRHLNYQHYEEKRVKITKINLEKERISCVNSCNWLEDSKEHISFNIDGNKFCADCKGDRIGHFRMEKAFKGYMEKIRDLNDIFHPELWVSVKRHYFDCCWCEETRNGDEGGGTFYEFANYPEHVFCDSCFRQVRKLKSFSYGDPKYRCQCEYWKILENRQSNSNFSDSYNFDLGE